MIIDTVRGDALRAPHKHIVFAVNAEGYNDAGFAGLVSSRFWPELANTGGNRLGDVLKKQMGGRTFHAIVCHELKRDGWSRTPQIVEEGVNKLDIPAEETIGVVLMGGGLVGQMSGADTYAVLGALARSNKRVTVYTL